MSTDQPQQRGAMSPAYSRWLIGRADAADRIEDIVRQIEALRFDERWTQLAGSIRLEGRRLQDLLPLLYRLQEADPATPIGAVLTDSDRTCIRKVCP